MPIRGWPSSTWLLWFRCPCRPCREALGIEGQQRRRSPSRGLRILCAAEGLGAQAPLGVCSLMRGQL